MPPPIRSAGVTYHQKAQGLIDSLADRRMTRAEMKSWISDLKKMGVKPTEMDAKIFGELINGRLKDNVDPGARKLYDAFLKGAAPAAPTNGNLQLSAAVRDFEKHVKTVQGRMTEEIRSEDWVNGVKVKGNKVEITLDPHHQSTPANLARGFAQTFAELGHPGIEVVCKVEGGGARLQDAAAALKAHVKTVQGRLTEEIRAEDWVKNVSVKGDGLQLTLDQHHQSTPARLADSFAQTLADLGFPGIKVTARVG